MDQDTATRGSGFGEAGYHIVRSLQENGFEVPFRDPAAPVELAFAHPHNWKWSAMNYRLGYFPWESTGLKENWVQRMKLTDEIWVPAPWMLIFKDLIDKPFYVYEHGIDFDVWKRTRRVRGERLRFLHLGEPAPRKGGQLALNAFVDLFANKEGVSLTIKADGYSQALGPENRHPYRCWNNVSVILDKLSEPDLVRLVQDHDVLLYPSYGEGFGFIPLQAMATGMPTICTADWAGYKRFILPELRLDSKLEGSPFDIHPGKMWHPDEGHLRHLMQYCYDNFERLAALAYAQVPYIYTDYQWKTLTNKAFRRFDTFSTPPG
jgi:glycosyltransferase involved in cell wall biosynthesis